MRHVHLLSIMAGGLLATGCSAPEARSLGGDVYALTASASRYNTGKREDLARQAAAFAESRGKVAVALPQPGTLSGIDRGGVVEYRFRLVDKDGSARQAPAEPVAPAKAEATPPPAPASPAKAEPPAAPKEASPARPIEPAGPRPDLYGELIKLDDLRKRGILTEAEFQAQKKKLLDAQK